MFILQGSDVESEGAEGHSELTTKSISFETQIKNYRTKNQKHFQNKCKWYNEIKKGKDVDHHLGHK